MAEEIGQRIAENNAILICGGKGGVMEAACKGAKEKSGLTVGILPGSGDDANRYVDVKIATEMSDGRNVINVKSGDSVIVIGGGPGTLSEIGFALNAGKKVVVLKPSGGVAEMVAGKIVGGQRIISVDSVDQAITRVFS